MVGNAGRSLGSLSQRSGASRTCDDALRDLDQIARRQARIRGLPGGLRFHVRVLVPDEVYRGESLQPLRARHQVICDGSAQVELPGEHQTEYAEAMVRRLAAHARRIE